MINEYTNLCERENVRVIDRVLQREAHAASAAARRAALADELRGERRAARRRPEAVEQQHLLERARHQRWLVHSARVRVRLRVRPNAARASDRELLLAFATTFAQPLRVHQLRVRLFVHHLETRPAVRLVALHPTRLHQ